MTEKQIKIDEFIKKMMTIYQDNFANDDINNAQSDIYTKNDIFTNFVYAQLSNFMNISLKNNWDEVKMNLDDLNANVLNSISNENFTVYVNPNINLNYGNCLKLYIPLTEFGFSNGATQILHYLDQSKMPFDLKLAGNVRNDDIVVRVDGLKEALTIIDFINSQKDIRSSIMPTNPFLLNIGGIGLSMDSVISYNYEVAKVVANYIKKVSKENIKETGIEDFKRYLEKKRIACTNPTVLRIFNLIDVNLRPNPGLGDFNIYLADMLRITSVRDKYQDVKNVQDENLFLEKKKALDLAIVTTMQKYGINQTKMALKLYARGNPKYFTNFNNVRINLINLVQSNELLSLINKILKRFATNNMEATYGDFAEIYLDFLGYNNSYNLDNTNKRA